MPDVDEDEEAPAPMDTDDVRDRLQLRHRRALQLALQAAASLKEAWASSEATAPGTATGERAAAVFQQALDRAKAAVSECEHIGAAIVRAASPPRVPEGVCVTLSVAGLQTGAYVACPPLPAE
jgi:hypothetical protein